MERARDDLVVEPVALTRNRAPSTRSRFAARGAAFHKPSRRGLPSELVGSLVEVPAMGRQPVPDRLEAAGRYASGRVLLVDLRDRLVPTLEAHRATDVADAELADQLARVALEVVARRLLEVARA